MSVVCAHVRMRVNMCVSAVTVVHPNFHATKRAYFFSFSVFLDLCPSLYVHSSRGKLRPHHYDFPHMLPRVVGGRVWIFSDYIETFCSSASWL